MEIGYELKKRLPKARIRYVIDRDKFGYAEFGDYFFWVDNGLYVWHKDEEYEEDHNPDIVADYFGHDCKGRGYTCRHIFAGIDTGYDDCDGSRMFTGDIVQVKTSVQKNISVGFSIEESLNRAHLEEHVKGAYVFVYVDTSKAVWRFRYFIISRQQFIKLLFAAHDLSLIHI